VSDEPASFNGEEKSLGCPLIPAFKDLLLGKAVKGYIQLYCGKIFSVEFKPPLLGKVRGIEDSIPPMRIVIAAGSDEDPILDCEMRNADCGVCRQHLNV
jgi:hypothetical protein